MSKKTHRKMQRGREDFLEALNIWSKTENRKPKDPFLVREGKNLLRVSHKNPFLQDAGHCFMLH